ncbi:MAG TPA: aminotransferase class IV, partial [Pirellulales bacterium]|nr:aminotransferase class IV [Pirellulales bacterium]
RWMPASRAAIMHFDAGFVLGATVSEQLRTFAGQLFRLDEHLDRLFHSLELVGVNPGRSQQELGSIATQLASMNHALLVEGDDLGLTIFVTPGPYATLAPPEAGGPVVGLHTYPLPFRIWSEKYSHGEHLVVTDVQQVPERCWPRQLKCRSRMHYFLADQRARQIDPDARAVLADERGCLTETASANLLVFRRGEGLVSPPLADILPGISRATVLELAAGLGIGTAERPLGSEDVAGADEVLLTSTPSCILPVTRFQGLPIGAGKPGEVYHQLLDAWGQAVGVDIAAQAICHATRPTSVPAP